MDPNALLKALRAKAEFIIKHTDTDEPDIDVTAEDAAELAEMIQNLDGWIMKGGFFPKDWREANEGFNKNP